MAWSIRAVLPIAALAAGCELLVPGSLPPYTCGPGNGSCPQGMTCDPSSSTCIDIADVMVGPDVSVEATNDVMNDVVTVQDSPMETSVCRGLGCTCSGPSDCDSQTCADQLTVGSGLWGAVNHGFCIAPCCTSNDCDTGFVCYASDAGGDYCVDPTLLGRSSTLGASQGGVTCSSDTSCRSGLCSTTCQDTCCSIYQGGECGGGACRMSAFPGNGFDTNLTPHCTTTSSGSGTGGCSQDSTCKSDLCLTGLGCVDTCRSAGDCQDCTYVLDTSNDIFTTCYAAGGSTSFGDSCTSDTTCESSICNTTADLCTGPCFFDSDCSSVTGWTCRPQEVEVMGGGSFSVLLCGP